MDEESVRRRIKARTQRQVELMTARGQELLLLIEKCEPIPHYLLVDFCLDRPPAQGYELNQLTQMWVRPENVVQKVLPDGRS